MIEEALSKFISEGNSIDWIIGIDQGITSREALEFLKGLQIKYPDNVNIRILTAGSNSYIFHPKAYCFENDEDCVILTGSANSTEGGLLGNFELSMKASFKKNEAKGQETYQDFTRVWNQYTTPLEPLTKDNLINLVSQEGEDLINKIGENSSEVKKARSSVRSAHPLNSINKGPEISRKIRAIHGPRTGINKGVTEDDGGNESKSAITRRNESQIKNETLQYLVMDILTETRKTQVQFPVEVMKTFLSGFESIELYYRDRIDGSITHESTRPIVDLPHNNTHRLEIIQIKDRERPLIMQMSMIPGTLNQFIYELVDKDDADFTYLDSLLNEEGKQTRKGSRRWVLK